MICLDHLRVCYIIYEYTTTTNTTTTIIKTGSDEILVKSKELFKEIMNNFKMSKLYSKFISPHRPI